MASQQELTKTGYAADLSDDDDITADNAPLLGMSEERHPAAPPPPYSCQKQDSWSTKPSTHYVIMDQPQTSPVAMVQKGNVKHYLPLSIFTLLCCCWPCGLWATIKSVEARTLARVGIYSEAMQKGKEARKFSIIGIIIGVVIISIFVAVYVWFIHHVMEFLATAQAGQQMRLDSRPTSGNYIGQ